jgi:hypothetical protein
MENQRDDLWPPVDAIAPAINGLFSPLVAQQASMAVQHALAAVRFGVIQEFAQSLAVVVASLHRSEILAATKLALPSLYYHQTSFSAKVGPPRRNLKPVPSSASEDFLSDEQLDLGEIG